VNWTLTQSSLTSIGFYTGTNMLSFCLAFLFMRETKQLTLEELDQVGRGGQKTG
jgi:hypothetical protein